MALPKFDPSCDKAGLDAWLSAYRIQTYYQALTMADSTDAQAKMAGWPTAAEGCKDTLLQAKAHIAKCLARWEALHPDEDDWKFD